MNILIPMAGDGSRFKKEGYQTSKPLIPIMGEPMVVRAAESFPPVDKYIFVCRDFHLSEDQVDKAITPYFKEAAFITTDGLTEGQASTCLLAKNLINNSDELYISACDNGMILDPTKLEKMKSENDVLIFSFRNNPTVSHKPTQYSWIETEGEKVIRVSSKVPLSENPVNDHAVVGAFWFREGSEFVRAAESMIAKNIRVNNEFYVDECINQSVELGLKVSAFEIDHYICWGTPDDLRVFEYWQEFFKKQSFEN